MNKKGIKVRLAPSPTGQLHIGTARTALFNYLFAKKNKGSFILRIEDTDQERSQKEYEKDIINSLSWLGLAWDEEYRQSERTEIHQKYLKRLIEQGLAFWCDHTKEELDQEKQKQIVQKQAPRHICDRKGKAKQGIIRFSCPERKIEFDDLVKGRLVFDGGLLGDISIAKDEKTPLYNFAAAIDDALMGISQVIRGEDHISNTPKQIFILEALGLELPEYGHLPLILGPDKTKLSKRHAVTSVSQYREMGYLPEAMVNFMAFLGWHPGGEREIFSLSDLSQEFSIDKVNKSNAIFNLEKLNWFNQHYIRQKDLDELTRECLRYLPQGIDFEYAKKVVGLERQRIKKLSEIGEITDFFFSDQLDYDKNLLIWQNMELSQVRENLEILYKRLQKVDNFKQEDLEGSVMPLTEEYGRGELLWPLRAALSGQKASPGPFELMEVLDREKSLERIKQAIEKIGE